MWDQYGKKHAGACLIFNREMFATQLDRDFPRGEWDNAHREVTYMDVTLQTQFDDSMINPEGFAGMLRTMRVQGQTSQVLYFIKNRDWESENEYRFLVFAGSENASKTHQTKGVSIANNLEAVVLGEAFPSSQISQLKKRVAHHNLPILRCTWVRGAPLLREEL
jgi:hypothetical protein